MAKIIDLNCDMGESFGVYKYGSDEEIITEITSANIACGWHGGDPMVMDFTVGLCKTHGVNPGAHPGFPDLVGFGRRNMQIAPRELRADIIYQVGALQAFAHSHGLKLTHVKPHGNFYNMAAQDEEMALSIAQAVKDVNKDLILVGLSGSLLVRTGEKIGLAVAHEVFADRGYLPNGVLVPRTEPGAIIETTEEAVSRMVSLLENGYFAANDGSPLYLKADTICLHGDTPNAAAYARAIRLMLEENGVRIAPMPEVLGL
ncbi:MAG: LamB/YcsF family protein [Firmicutes bacterium]|nr:LamB/YcsF family protein [Bacillota bacterium]